MTETIYAGCIFDHKIDAQWAVFFDTLGIEWRYKEEIFENERGWIEPTFRFYRSREQERASDLFAIVRSNSHAKDLVKDADYWTDMNDFGGVLPGFNDSLRDDTAGLMLLGSIPRVGNSVTFFHPIIQHCKGLHKSWFMFSPYASFAPIEIAQGFHIPDLLGIIGKYDNDRDLWLIETRSVAMPNYYPSVEKAYETARSYNFVES